MASGSPGASSVPRGHADGTHTDPILSSSIEDLLKNRDFDSRSSSDLAAIQSVMTSSIPLLFSRGSYVQARAYIVLNEDIANELSRRGAQKQSSQQQTFGRNPRLQQFDRETSQKLAQLRGRHERMMASLEEIWTTQTRKHYSGEAAEAAFESDFGRARKRLAQNQRLEFNTYLADRKTRRSLIVNYLRGPVIVRPRPCKPLKPLMGTCAPPALISFYQRQAAIQKPLSKLTDTSCQAEFADADERVEGSEEEEKRAIEATPEQQDGGAGDIEQHDPVEQEAGEIGDRGTVQEPSGGQDEGARGTEPQSPEGEVEEAGTEVPHPADVFGGHDEHVMDVAGDVMGAFAGKEVEGSADDPPPGEFP